MTKLPEILFYKNSPKIISVLHLLSLKVSTRMNITENYSLKESKKIVLQIKLFLSKKKSQGRYLVGIIFVNSRK